jgi:mRNA-degrading endonuclease HigB of HigAB toxin-antitoxin module
MEYAKELLSKEGFSAEELEIGTTLEYSAELYYDMSVGKPWEDQITIMQLYVQNGDIMRAPEIVFDISGDEWTPITHVNHEVRPQVYEHDEGGLGDEVKEFIEFWEDNLRMQYPLDDLNQYRVESHSE